MKFIASFLALLLLPLLLSLSLNAVAHLTLLNPTYLQNKLTQTHTTTDLSNALPGVISQQVGSDIDPSLVQKAVQTALSPDTLQTKFNDVITQTNAFLTQNGTIPSIDVKDIADQARASGIDLPQDFASKPLTIPTDTAQKIQANYTTYQHSELAAMIAALILFLIIFLISVKTHSYGSLIMVTLEAAIIQFVLYFIAKDAPSYIFNNLPPAAPQYQSLVAIGERFGTAVLADMAHLFIEFGIGFLVVTIILIGLAIISSMRHKAVTAPSK